MAATVRDATPDDIPAMVAIYNQLARDTTVLWTDEEQTVAKRTEWYEARRARGFPVFVAEVDDTVVGVASYADFRDAIDKPGYRFTAELSIHLAVGHRSQGLGPRLLGALTDHARERGIHVLVAGIDGDNEGSVRFHERHGFTTVAHLHQVGWKFGRWLDLILMQKVLDEP